jgi:hypothetical protein
MLSSTSRVLTYATAALAAITGAILFFDNAEMAPVFAWKVSPFMLMTIGAWCLGNAWMAFMIANHWNWSNTFASHTYLWAFGILEALVLIRHLGLLVMGHAIAWLYLAMIVANLLTAFIGIIEWRRFHVTVPPSTKPYPQIILILNWVFFIFVTLLGLYGTFAPIGAPGTSGGIFPEKMSPFTLHAFGAFYLALGFSAIPLLVKRNIDALLFHSVAAYALLVLITAAAFYYLNVFHFSDAPGGFVYIGAYLLVGIVLAIVMYIYRASVREKFDAPG